MGRAGRDDWHGTRALPFARAARALAGRAARARARGDQPTAPRRGGQRQRATAPHRRQTKRCCSTRAPARCLRVSAKSTRSTSPQADLELWGLADRLPAPIDEDLSRGERVCVVEAGGARLAILVCEDLARLHAFAAALHAHGVSLILVPVFARPTKDRRWERARAEVYSDAIGSSVVVANSLVIAEILRSPAPVGTAIAVAPGQRRGGPLLRAGGRGGVRARMRRPARGARAGAARRANACRIGNAVQRRGRDSNPRESLRPLLA